MAMGIGLTGDQARRGLRPRLPRHEAGAVELGLDLPHGTTTLLGVVSMCPLLRTCMRDMGERHGVTFFQTLLDLSPTARCRYGLVQLELD